MSPKRRRGAGMDEDRFAALEARVKALEDDNAELRNALKTVGGKLRTLPPDATPLDAHKLIIEAGGSLANIKGGKRK